MSALPTRPNSSPAIHVRLRVRPRPGQPGCSYRLVPTSRTSSAPAERTGRRTPRGIGAQWLAGHLYFTSSPAARKARDLAVNPLCTISGRLPGIDLVLDGSAARVTDPQTLEQVAAGYRAGGWPAQVDGDALTAPFNAPSAGPPPWHVYRFTFHTVVGVATIEPYGATRWRFQR